MSQEEKDSIHVGVIKGIIRVILFLVESKKKNQSVSIKECYSVGTEGISGEAPTFILEFIKDGIHLLNEEAVNKIVDGDYSGLWIATNKYLKNFGYEPIEPVEIDL